MVIAGIFGPKLSGKTTLARSLSFQYWRQCRMRTLALDPNSHEHHLWGKHVFVTADETHFWQCVWQTRQCLIVVDEAAATIRRERELVPAFTRIRHNHHKVIVIGHSGADLLPVMRQQLDQIYLFRQPKQSAEIWAETFCEDGLLQATSLQQYEFIKCDMFQKPQKMRLQL